MSRRSREESVFLTPYKQILRGVYREILRYAQDRSKRSERAQNDNNGIEPAQDDRRHQFFHAFSVSDAAMA
ncbi:MAG: hypothetical protein ACRD1O_12950 [Terriglobia bacterium]